MLNSAIMIGRLTAHPERKATQDGTCLATFRIAVDRNFTDKNGNRKADFFNVEAWSNTAEFVCKYFGKGDLIGIDGRFRSRTWQGEDGRNHYTAYVRAEEVFFVGAKRQKNEEAGGEEPAEEVLADDSDLPF